MISEMATEIEAARVDLVSAICGLEKYVTKMMAETDPQSDDFMYLDGEFGAQWPKKEIRQAR